MTTIYSPVLVAAGAPQVLDAGGTARPLLDAARLNDGRGVVVYSNAGLDADGTGVRAFFTDADGVRLPGEVAINSFTTGNQGDPDVAVLTDGSFVVTWTSEGQDGAGTGVYARRFTAEGLPQGQEFQVSGTAPFSQGEAHVTALANGGFAIAWEQPVALQGGRPQTEIYSRAYDAAGLPLSGGLRVNPNPNYAQLEDVVADANGGFQVFWLAQGANPQEGHFRTVFAQPGQAATATVRLSEGFHVADQGVEYFPLADGTLLVRILPIRGTGPNIDLRDSASDPADPGMPAQPMPHDFFRQPSDASFVSTADGHLQAFYVVERYDGPDIALATYTQSFRLNGRASGELTIAGDVFVGGDVTAVLTGLSDADGLGALSYRWYSNDRPLGTEATLTLTEDLRGSAIRVEVSYTDGAGTAERLVSAVTAPLNDANIINPGTPGPDFIEGGSRNDTLSGAGGNDTILGYGGDDSIAGGDGSDTLNGGDGNDSITGGASTADLRDVIYGGAGDDLIFAGFGNDEAYGGAGSDTMDGGYGADTVFGNEGADTLNGGTFGDVLFGGDGFDFLNGGFGSDRLNGGAGPDRFFHLGIRDHGSDFIQDYRHAEEDRLVSGIANATRAQFQVNFANTPNAGAAGVAEAFVIYTPTGQILWALVDGAAQDRIIVQAGGNVFDLLA